MQSWKYVCKMNISFQMFLPSKWRTYHYLLILPLITAKKLKVGIIGAGINDLVWSLPNIWSSGIGGTSAAYFLAQETDADVTVFEKDDVGGRLATVEIDGRMYESGGSIIHNSNKFMVNFLDICKLRKKKPMTSETFSVLADDGIIFQVKSEAFALW